MKKRYISKIILLFFIGFFLQACVPSIPDRVQTGFEHLKSGEVSLAKEEFNKVLNLSYNPMKKALASEGLGWCYYLEQNFTLARFYFSQAKETYPTKKEILSGLALAQTQLGEFSSSVDIGLFLLSSADDVLVDYLPDTLYKEELLKVLVLAALISSSSYYEDFKALVSDADFLNKLGALEGGE
ncbi:hypothetical protein AT15_08100 [Kosmotoga arenicorallina S304]|uniref:Tetratricopeptide repeat protein n=1 Tax=Kosmotoga arenicorallina S304 TaxID=1453497 RepID=A0A176K2K2_9BACT|nr:hypothetical protein [Kosmotoga arenicorallina]OAA31446.1 hypothetical protein AT15_08100 [Kosmotoga arenicorallina S304]